MEKNTTNNKHYSYNRKIFIKDLVLPCLIGVYDYERKKKQSIRITLSIDCYPPTSLEDTLSSTLNYETIYTGVCTLVHNSQYMLLETLGYHIAILCLQEKRAAKVTVTIEKLHMFKFIKSVGVETILEK